MGTGCASRLGYRSRETQCCTAYGNSIIRCAVRLSRSKALANVVRLTFPQSLEVEACTVNKATASFRVGELRREVHCQRHDTIRLARSCSQKIVD